MYGMTGYSFNEQYYEDVYISTEVRTVNHRFLELNVSVPFYLSSMEMQIKDLISSRIKRGKVDVTVHLKVNEQVDSVIVNNEMAQMYYNKLVDLAKVLNMDPNEIKIQDIIKFEDVITVDKKHDYNEYWDKIANSLNKNLDDVIAMRTHEGEETKKDLINNINIIEENVITLANAAPQMEQDILTNIKSKVQELIGDKVDENKLLTEVAIMVSRACINEEVERLKMHIQKVREVFDSEIDVGKRIDFLCQEMHREINTTGSKVVDAKYTQNVIVVKNCIEKIREQIRNIE